MEATTIGSPATGMRGGLRWSERVPQAMGVFMLCVSAVIALQRHQFTHPGFQLIVIVAITFPWVLDMFAWPEPLVRQHSLEWPVMVLWSAAVLAGVSWLSVVYRGPNDLSLFMVTILVGQMAATMGPRFGFVLLAIGIGLEVTVPYALHIPAEWIWGFAFTIGWIAGVGYRRQAQIAFELEEAQSQLAEQAAEDERHRLARDIHDLIAHSLAVTMLQLTGARLALKAGDTGEALAALEDAEAAGRAAMAEIHRTVGLLGTGDGASPQSPTPNAGDLPELVAEFRRAGLTIDFELDGTLTAVPLATGLAAYRLVQESLSNTVKHAPGAPVRLTVTVTGDDITIKVVNPVVVGTGAPTVGGNGVRGMAERAELLGGVATAGNGDGTWKVDARLPWVALPA
jgi:signal transduction histidine kinase